MTKIHLTPLSFDPLRCLFYDVVSRRVLELTHLYGSIESSTIDPKKNSISLHTPHLVKKNDEDSRSPVPPQILDGVLLDSLGLDVQIRPTLDGLPVDSSHSFQASGHWFFPSRRNILCGHTGGSGSVIDVLPDDLVWADGRPPKRSVEYASDEGRDGFRKDRSGVGFQGEGLDQFDEVGVGVRPWSGKSKGGSDGSFGCSTDDREGFGDI
jgi:hypothetical protein